VDKPRALARVSLATHGSFEADGERQVSSPIELWFRNGGRLNSRHQSKIYVESNHCGLQSIFDDFT
jgi:hypothetical protein